MELAKFGAVVDRGGPGSGSRLAESCSQPLPPRPSFQEGGSRAEEGDPRRTGRGGGEGRGEAGLEARLWLVTGTGKGGGEDHLGSQGHWVDAGKAKLSSALFSSPCPPATEIHRSSGGSQNSSPLGSLSLKGKVRGRRELTGDTGAWRKARSPYSPEVEQSESIPSPAWTAPCRAQAVWQGQRGCRPCPAPLTGQLCRRGPCLYGL